MPAHDLTIERDGELMVFQAQGETDGGVEYVDAYIPVDGQNYQVVDAGRIILPYPAEEDFLDGARKRGLTWERITR